MVIYLLVNVFNDGIFMNNAWFNPLYSRQDSRVDNPIEQNYLSASIKCSSIINVYNSWHNVISEQLTCIYVTRTIAVTVGAQFGLNNSQSFIKLGSFVVVTWSVNQ